MEERHTIKLVIAGRTYTKVLNQEQEAIARKAAKRLEDNISNLGSMYPSVSALDILTVVALNESMEVLRLQQGQSSDSKDLKRLADDLQKYVDSIE